MKGISMSIILKKESFEKLLKDNFHTIHSLANQTNLSYAVILNAFNHGKPLSMKSAEKLCKFFEVSFDELFVK